MKIENSKMNDSDVFCTTKMVYSDGILKDFSVKFHHSKADTYYEYPDNEFRYTYDNGIIIRFIVEYNGDGYDSDDDPNLFISRCAIFKYDMQRLLRFNLEDAEFEFESGETGSLIMSGVMISVGYFIYNFFKDYNDVRQGVIRFSKDVSNGCRMIGNMMSDENSVERRRQMLERKHPHFEEDVRSMERNLKSGIKNKL